VIDGRPIAIAASHQDQSSSRPAGTTTIFHSTFTPQRGTSLCDERHWHCPGSRIPNFTPAFAPICCEFRQGSAPDTLVASAKASLEPAPRSRRPRPARSRALLARRRRSVSRRDNLTPTGIIATSVFRKYVKPQIKKYFAFPKGETVAYLSPARPARGASAVVTNEGRVAVDADCAFDEGARGVRRRRVVLTPRCWRQFVRSKASHGRWWQESRSPGRARSKP